MNYEPKHVEREAFLLKAGFKHGWENLESQARRMVDAALQPIDMVLHCPACGMQHIDEPEGEGDDEATVKRLDVWTNPPHRSHLCHGCGHIWRPADVPTNGVAAVKTRGKDDSPIVSLAAERRKVDALREALRNLLMFECDDQMPRHEADCHEFAGSTVKRDLLVAAMDALAATMDALAATKGEK